MNRNMTVEENQREMTWQIYNDFIRAVGCVTFLDKVEREKLSDWLEGCKVAHDHDTNAILGHMQNFIERCD